jgi:hypothetical protein
MGVDPKNAHPDADPALSHRFLSNYWGSSLHTQQHVSSEQEGIFAPYAYKHRQLLPLLTLKVPDPPHVPHDIPVVPEDSLQGLIWVHLVARLPSKWKVCQYEHAPLQVAEPTLSALVFYICSGTTSLAPCIHAF